MSTKKTEVKDEETEKNDKVSENKSRNNVKKDLPKGEIFGYNPKVEESVRVAKLMEEKWQKRLKIRK